MEIEMSQEKLSMNKLGMDVGGLYVKAVAVNGAGRIIQSVMLPHRGEVRRTLLEAWRILAEQGPFAGLGLVGSQAAAVAGTLGLQPLNPVQVIIDEIGRRAPACRHVIDAGGSSLSLITLDERGRLLSYDENTLCAAGTGSFLDEQAERLGIDYNALPGAAEIISPPPVATRCAVFAKSDLIHLQQEGHGKPALWSGLCRGLARTIRMTLFKGKRPLGPVAFIGGVALNNEVVRWLSREFRVDFLVPEDPALVSALGAASLAGSMPSTWDSLTLSAAGADAAERRPSLELQRSNYPSFDVQEAWTDAAGNEVRITRWPESGRLRGVLGLDVGSTSTKLAMVDEAGEVVLDIYRKTAGDPIGATKHLLRALGSAAKRRNLDIQVLGVGTTGSGRKLVGAVLGADRVVNEITAHVTGAMAVDSEIDTIFEIGGQDAKYIHARDGRLHDSNMNYVCAAGTGSFVEELARKLGFPVQDVGAAVLGVEPPVTSDRCTVFMEQDARSLLRKGFSPREVMGAIMYSVVQNYLTKVVGSRHVSPRKVFFQGATARNRGLAAAFENLLDVEVVVSPYCHVMGSYGVALLTREQMRCSGEKTRFPGLGFANAEVKLEQDICELCNNNCRITRASVEGLAEQPSWGYLCGRDPDGEKVRVRREYDLFRLRDRLWRRAAQAERTLPTDAPVIGMPRALLAWSYGPFWRAFFADLGYRVIFSRPTDRELVDGSNEWVGADYCFPVKLAHGHLRDLVDRDDVALIFVPHMLAAPSSDKTTNTWFCPYNIGLPAVLQAALHQAGRSEIILRATVDFRWNESRAARRLEQDLSSELNVGRKQLLSAWRAGRKAQESFETSLREQGGAGLKEIIAGGKPSVVVLGRPYNTFDPGANLELPAKIAGMGFPVVPLEFLPLDDEFLGEEFGNTFWNSGRRILEATRFVARTPGLYPVYFSNFSCGPDSFLQTYAEAMMGDKPMLMLELDEHGADAGYMTRIEAFADVIRGNNVDVARPFRFTNPRADKQSLRDRTLWLPPMHEAASPLAAAAMRACGYNARALPLEDEAAFQMGRTHTRGGECLPCPATLGTFIKTVKDAGGDPSKHALFMPTASGPCRFGQYCTLNRMVFDRLGWRESPIVSWSSTNSYDGTGLKTRRYIWTAMLLGDLLYKMRCRVVPYELQKGETEALYRRWLRRLDAAIEQREDLPSLVTAARDDFLAVPRHNEPRPLVGIVGEIYVRHNPFTNQDVVRRIEAAGGEAWMAPISEWIIYTAAMESWLLKEGRASLADRLSAGIRNRFIAMDETAWTRRISPLLDDRHEPPIEDTLRAGEPYFPREFEGESIITVGRAIEFMKAGTALVVNCAPFGCMPGTMTAGIFREIEQRFGVPVANMFYDGEGDLNERIGVYLGCKRTAADTPPRERAQPLR